MDSLCCITWLRWKGIWMMSQNVCQYSCSKPSEPTTAPQPEPLSLLVYGSREQNNLKCTLSDCWQANSALVKETKEARDRYFLDLDLFFSMTTWPLIQFPNAKANSIKSLPLRIISFFFCQDTFLTSVKYTLRTSMSLFTVWMYDSRPVSDECNHLRCRLQPSRNVMISVAHPDW